MCFFNFHHFDFTAPLRLDLRKRLEMSELKADGLLLIKRVHLYLSFCANQLYSVAAASTRFHRVSVVVHQWRFRGIGVACAYFFSVLYTIICRMIS